VRLPSPGKTFTATAGIDTNDQTSGGRGSVVFAVKVAGKEAFKSGVVREGMPPLEVSADLRGEATFMLQIGDAGDGMIQVFRRAESPYESARLRLRGLAAEARYAFADLDTGRTTEATGKELAEKGLPLAIEAPRTAAVLMYKQLP